MSISAPFIRRPVGTSLLAAALLLSGILAFKFLPVASLPKVDFPVISVGAGLPGADPQTMASAVATPLERQFGRIAAVNQLTSSSQLGSTGIALQFDLNRNIDAAARDVQAAINAARGQLPTNLPSNPTYRKVNPADAPILLLGLTSDTTTVPQMYDACDSILSQKLAQVDGVGQVFVWGAAQPAVRAEVNPMLLNQLGVGLDTVRNALNAANANRPKGQVADGTISYSLDDTDQLFTADQYRPLIVGYNNGGAVRLGDVADVQDSVSDVRNLALINGKLGIVMPVFRQPGANIIETVDRVRTLLPYLQSSISPAMKLSIVMDRTTTVRASVKDIERTLLISIALVIMVVFVFLRTVRATIIPSIAVPLSLVGTFGGMYLLGYSLDNLSLMALAISTGFVVDDAIVVLENITRYVEHGMDVVQAAFKGAAEIGFTVLSMSTSLVAVFIPLLMMGGIVGRLFREFAVTLSIAIGVSLLVSLTTTPTMCAKFLRPGKAERHNAFYRASEWFFDRLLANYTQALKWVLANQPVTLTVTILVACLSVYLYVKVPKGFFPQQDTGRIQGTVMGAQDISFQSMSNKMRRYVKIVMQDPAVDTMAGSTGGSTALNQGRFFVMLKPLEQRGPCQKQHFWEFCKYVTADDVINRLRGKLEVVPGATLILQSAQELTIGGRYGNAQYQYTLQSSNLDDLNNWAPRLLAKLKTLPELRDQNSDQQDKGLQAQLVIDRDTASRLGITAQTLDNALYDAFGQRQVSTMYRPLNQYHVVMEVAPQFQQTPEALENIYLRSTSGTPVPLSAFTHFEPSNTPLAVNHQGQVPSATISFNLAPGVSLGQATEAIENAERTIGFPPTIQASFQGTAAAFQDSKSNMLILIIAALGAVYIVLGMLYESYIHPITILSTIPSAGVGALLALLLTHNELNVIGMIGIILLIGLVKKNAIMMIDVALVVERTQGKKPVEAIYDACLLRFRPIMMTTMAALLGGLPLALGRGTGSELHRPLGITIVGGLIVSQMLTLFTTPVVYVYLDRLRLALRGGEDHALPETTTPRPSPAH
ncbi:multidrug efflux system, subunit C [Candidatus Sulfotelmatobacter kueseliae]|uniref:Multidrug efflux system, subunit C n=1 Tax=Candidatus Sulfotelmatobacter kueseliae TaxID=2042962 RepID=A0A2U3KYH9_9BACT|nr:multidrug efflux system, subunit C [Candidatus Sulfotelmatobacter kueseliae]